MFTYVSRFTSSIWKSILFVPSYGIHIRFFIQSRESCWYIALGKPNPGRFGAFFLEIFHWFLFWIIPRVCLEHEAHRFALVYLWDRERARCHDDPLAIWPEITSACWVSGRSQSFERESIFFLFLCVVSKRRAPVRMMSVRMIKSKERFFRSRWYVFLSKKINLPICRCEQT